MSDALLTSYEELPYHSDPFHETLPDNLAVLGQLFGMTPADPARCRVLELGCAAGGNLVPMALAMPEGRFLGIDLSPRQIRDGQDTIRRLGLSNIELRAASILDVDSEWGEFDYVVCHGVYSWVPSEVQDKILSICRENLAPQGIAYVSYNVYPGWHLRGMVRDMLRYRAATCERPVDAVREAREFLEFLARFTEEPKSAHAFVLKVEVELLRDKSDTYVYHEELEPFNSPVYFHEFVARAGRHGLQFVSEARLADMATTLPPEARQRVQAMTSDLVEREQYVDFLRGRPFRRSLLCRQEIALDRDLDPERLRGLSFTALASPEHPDHDPFTVEVERFRSTEGVTLSTNNPAMKACLGMLFRAWPRTRSLDELESAVRREHADARASRPGVPDLPADSLAPALLQCYVCKLIEVHRYSPPVTFEPGDRPRTSPLARLQAERGGRLTNLRHRLVELSPFDLRVVGLLDGSRALDDVAQGLRTCIARGELVLDDELTAMLAEVGPEEFFAAGLAASLHRIAGSSLLVQS